MTVWKTQILEKAIRIQKGNLGVTTHFSELTELKFGNRMPYVLRILRLFLKLWLLNYI